MDDSQRQQIGHDGTALERLLQGGSRVAFAAGDVLPANGSIYCALDGIAVVSLRGDDTQIQVGFAGPGDLIFLQRLLVPAFPAMSAVVLRGGRFRAIPVDDVQRAARADGALDRALRDHATATSAGFLTEAVAAATLGLQRRVARWICAARDVLASDILPVTHQFVAAALGVRRSGVTVALHGLEGDRLIRSRRVRIEVLDPTRLLRLADGGAVPVRSDEARLAGATVDAG